jgi:hypothetical protein
MIGMNEKELRATLEAIRSSLGARPITREQLAEKVAAKVGPKGRERMMSGWGEMLKPAAFHGYLCSGPPRGQSVTFVRPDRWLKKWKIPEASAAWREIVRRYLRAYGPAGRSEFARWWGMQPAPAGRVLKTFESELSEVDVEGDRAWVLAEDLPAIERAHLPAEPRLLPAFDAYVAGTRPRSSLVEQRFEDNVFRRAGWISPVIIVAGRIVGIWKHEAGDKRTNVTIEPFQKVGAPERRALIEEAEGLGRFLNAPAEITFV